MTINKVLIGGNLTRVPEVRFTPKGTAVADLSIAINESHKDANGKKIEKTSFVDCVAWSGTAEFAGKYLAKGARVLVSGRLEQQSWEDKDTKKQRSKIVLVIEELNKLDWSDEEKALAKNGAKAPVKGGAK